MVAESTRVPVNAVQGHDYQAENGILVRLIGLLIDPMNKKVNPLTIVAIRKCLIIVLNLPNHFFDDRIGPTQLGLNPSDFKIMKENIKERIKILI